MCDPFCGWVCPSVKYFENISVGLDSAWLFIIQCNINILSWTAWNSVAMKKKVNQSIGNLESVL